MKNNNYKMEIIDVLGILSDSKTGWNKAILKISWNNEPPSIDIRNVNLDTLKSDNPKIGKGICLTDEQVDNLIKCLLTEGYLTDSELHEIMGKRNTVYKVDNNQKRKIIKVIGKCCVNE